MLSCFCFCVCVYAEWGSTKTGEQEDLIATALNCVLKVPQYLPQEQRFDVRVLVRIARHPSRQEKPREIRRPVEYDLE